MKNRIDYIVIRSSIGENGDDDDDVVDQTVNEHLNENQTKFNGNWKNEKLNALIGTCDRRLHRFNWN